MVNKQQEPELECKKPAKDFTLGDAVSDFNLTYSAKYMDAAKHLWTIETMPDVRVMQPSASLDLLESFLNGYTTIYDRTSEAGCKVAIDLLLCDCIAQLRSKLQFSPKRWENVKVFSDISITHTVSSESPNLSKGVVVSGRADRGVGIAFRSGEKPKTLFHSLLVCVGLKTQGNFLSALSQLVVYLASLRQSRIDRRKCDSSVYGVATEGLAYVFVTITNAGVLQKSRQFDVMNGDLPTVLGCLRYILEKALSNMTPKDVDELF